MNIWLVDPFEQLPVDDFPLARFRQLSRELAGRGHQVTWWASDFFHFLKQKRDGTHAPTLDDPYWIRMLPAMPYARNTSALRLASHARLAASAYRTFDRAMKGEDGEHHAIPDLIVCCWTPVELAASTARFAAKYGIPLCLDVPDPWPDSFATILPRPLKHVSPLLLWPHRILSRRAMQRAQGVTAVSRTFLEWALSLRGLDKSVQNAVFYPAARAQRNLPTRDMPGRPLGVVFAGTLGAMYDFDLMLEGARIVEERNPGTTRFIFAGSGPRQAELRSLRHSRNVEFTGPLSEEDLARLMRQCDVGLCCFPPEAPTTLTTKLFHYLSFALPVVGTPQQEMADFLAEHAVGVTISSGEDLANAVHSFCRQPGWWRSLSQSARAFSVEHSLEQEVSKMADFVLSLAGVQR